MKALNYLLLFFWVLYCKENEPKNFLVLSSSPFLKLENNQVFFKDKKFNGTLYQLYPNQKDTLFLENYKEGKLNGVSKKWFPNKQLMEYREFKNGEKDGPQILYWENGQKRIAFTAKNGVSEGELKEWSFEGKLFHLAHYKNGQEEGAQKMWYDNGKIRANYVIINGKRYGLLGTKNCKNVSDSVFVIK